MVEARGSRYRSSGGHHIRTRCLNDLAGALGGSAVNEHLVVGFPVCELGETRCESLRALEAAAERDDDVRIVDDVRADGKPAVAGPGQVRVLRTAGTARIRRARQSDLTGATVNEDLVAGHEAGVVGGEERDGLGDFLGAAQPPRGDV